MLLSRSRRPCAAGLPRATIFGRSLVFPYVRGLLSRPRAHELPPMSDKRLAAPGSGPIRGRALDPELVAMLKARAEADTADPDDGFVSALHEHDHTLAIDGLMIYAWGPSAAVLAKNLGMDRTPRTKRLAAAAAPEDVKRPPKLTRKALKQLAAPKGDESA